VVKVEIQFPAKDVPVGLKAGDLPPASLLAADLRLTWRIEGSIAPADPSYEVKGLSHAGDRRPKTGSERSGGRMKQNEDFLEGSLRQMLVDLMTPEDLDQIADAYGGRGTDAGRQRATELRATAARLRAQPGEQ
jgi:hypothetical protein